MKYADKMLSDVEAVRVLERESESNTALLLPS